MFTSILISEGVGWHFEGQPGTKNLQVRSINTGGLPVLVGVVDNHIPLSTSDIILENMDISSASVATGDGWTPVSTWVAKTRSGVGFLIALSQLLLLEL